MTLLTLTSPTTAGSPTEEFEVQFFNPLILDSSSRPRVALTDLTMWYSWYNISEAIGNNTLKVKDYVYTVPDGAYTIDNLNDYFYTNVGSGLKFEVDHASSRIILRFNDGTVDLTGRKIADLFGLEQKLYDTSSARGTKPINITNGVDRVLVHCSLVEGSYLNAYKSDVIYSFYPTAPPGGMIVEKPARPIYFAMRQQDVVERVKISITDQNNNPIGLNQESVTVVLHIA